MKTTMQALVVLVGTASWAHSGEGATHGSGAARFIGLQSPFTGIVSVGGDVNERTWVWQRTQGPSRFAVHLSSLIRAIGCSSVPSRPARAGERARPGGLPRGLRMRGSSPGGAGRYEADRHGRRLGER